jgi:hypothetical protein
MEKITQRGVPPREVIHSFASSATFISDSRSLKPKVLAFRQAPFWSLNEREKVAEKNGPFDPSLSHIAALIVPWRRISWGWRANAHLKERDSTRWRS